MLALFEKFLVFFHLLELLGQILRCLLLLFGFIFDSGDLRFDLKDIILLLLDQFLDGLESFIPLLHSEEGLLPVIEQRLFGLDNLFYLNGCLLKSVSSSGSFFFLGDELSLVQSLLLIQSFNFLIHRINEHILTFLLFFKVKDGLLSTVSGSTGDGNLRFHYFIVFFDLLKGAVQLIELFLRLENSLQLIVSLFFL